MDESIEITVPSDDEGYVSFECPHCGERFKLHGGEFDQIDSDRVYCPLCGLFGEAGEFLTREVREVMELHATELAQKAIDDMLRGLERKTRGNKFLQFKKGKRSPREPIPELKEVTDLAIVQFSCCDRTAKVPHSDALSGSYCPYCGTEHA